MEQIKQTTRWLLALGLLSNAIWMLVAPRHWYDTLPGVALTGSFNIHFVRDIGCAYLATALGLGWHARRAAAWPAAMVATLFLLLHGALHIFDLWQGRCPPAGFMHDAPAVILPALVALWLSRPSKQPARPASPSTGTTSTLPTAQPLRRPAP